MKYTDRDFYESALLGLRAQRAQIDAKITQIEAELRPPATEPRRYTISPEGRARIAAAQKKRWAVKKRKARAATA